LQSPPGQCNARTTPRLEAVVIFLKKARRFLAFPPQRQPSA